METVKVSIVTVVFNAKDRIEKCIESVLNQTYTNIEYIIIDGGSNDGTLDVIKRYSNKINCIISEPDKGISDAFNKGIKLATGELISLLNADDYYNTNTVELVVRKYIENNSLPLTVFHGDLCVIKKNKSKVYPPGKLSRFKFELPVWHPTVFATKDVYEHYLYNIDFKIAMDYDLLSRFYSGGGHFIYIPEILNNMTDGGISNTSASRGFKEVKHASRKNLHIPAHKALLYFLYRHFLYKLMTIKKHIID